MRAAKFAERQFGMRSPGNEFIEGSPATSMQRTRSSPSVRDSPRTGGLCPRAGMVFLAALIFLPGSASPCSCAPKQEVADELKLADAVFSAEVTKLEVLPSWWAEMGSQTDPELLEENPGQTPIRVLKVTFTVMKAWKGLTDPVVVIRTIADCCICGSTFAIGQRYLVYAFRERGDGTFWTSICSRTMNLDKAAEDLKELGPPAVDHEKRRADKDSGRGGGGS